MTRSTTVLACAQITQLCDGRGPGRHFPAIAPNGGSARGNQGSCKKLTVRQPQLRAQSGRISIHRHAWGGHPHLPHFGHVGSGDNWPSVVLDAKEVLFSQQLI